MKLINKCDIYFDRWNEKYFKVANLIRNVVKYWSHKMFMLPYTHFFGYLHLTVRIQDNMKAWQWDVDDFTKFYQKTLSMKTIEQPGYKYKGRLVDKIVGSLEQIQNGPSQQQANLQQVDLL